MLRSASACLILAGMLLLAGCGSGGGGSTASTPATPHTATGQGKLYVSDTANNSISRFDGALTANGAFTGSLNANVNISGALTTLSSPGNMIVDPLSDRLFVLNGGSNTGILIFEAAHLKTGNASPDRTISGNATRFIAPVDMTLDAKNDLLYVADRDAGNATPPGAGIILVFAQVSSVSGNTPPVRTLTLSFVPTAIFLNAATDQLFVADGSHNAIDVFSSVSNRSGAISATQIITQGTNTADNTQLAGPNSLQLDSTGQLIVGNAVSQVITVYANAATATGNVSPVAIVGPGGTGLSSPNQIALNPNTGDLYIGNGAPETIANATPVAAGNILIFGAITTVTGTKTTPTRFINGSIFNVTPPNTTTTITVKGIALDPTR